MNQQLLQAKTKLAHANEQLETRVTERTQKLEQMNIELGLEHHTLMESLAQVQRTQAQLVHTKKMVAVGQLAAEWPMRSQ